MDESQSDSTETYPCPVCGGRDFTYGDLYDQPLGFFAKSASLFSKIIRVTPFRLKARKCKKCKNLQLFDGRG